MLYYFRIDVSDGIDVDKTSESKECDICHYYFVNKGFNFQPKCLQLMLWYLWTLAILLF